MCGIAGIFAHGVDAPPADRAALGRMHDRMIARGPDGEGVWQTEDGRAAFSHRRLAIIDLTDGGAQPMVSADGRHVITYNGEIYNYRALRDELIGHGVRFRSDSDTEVILALYARDGVDALKRLRGMFAFAIWDGEKNGVLLARDGYGIKPLYYADAGGTLRFASQVKAVVAGGGIDTRPEPAGHAGFFLLGAVPEPYTLYRGVKALPAGHTMWVDGDGARSPAGFFDLCETLRDAEGANPKDFDPGELRAALADSVAHHLIADVPVGVFLSAGLDSATLAALAAEQATGALRTLTLAFDEYAGTANDEAPLAEALAAGLGCAHETVRVEGRAFTEERARLIESMDQPSTDGANSYFVARAAARAGLKVAISGLGGDELFGGYDTFDQVPRLAGALGRVPGARIFGRGFRMVSAPVLSRLTSPKYAGLFEYGAREADAYLLRRALFMPWELPRVLDPDLAAEGWRALAPRLRIKAADGLATPRARITAYESLIYMRNQLLRDADWAGMAHSLEIRVPLVDTALLARLAPMLAGLRPPTKRHMATTPSRPLPAAVMDRPKTGFAVPIRDWMGGESTERGLRGWAREIYAEF